MATDREERASLGAEPAHLWEDQMPKTVQARFGPFAGLALGAAMLTAVPATASPQDPADSTQQDTATAPTELRRDGDRRICVREQLTGTRVRTTICKTQREWDAEAGGRDRD
jgi:hypothetical protein